MCHLSETSDEEDFKMKKLFAVVLFVVVMGALVISTIYVRNSNLSIKPAEHIRTFLASYGEDFHVNPGGEFVFLHLALVSCESKRPFSITGKAADTNNEIVRFEVAGRYMVTGSSRVNCSFVSVNSLPVAYAVLQPEWIVNLQLYLFVIGAVSIFAMLIVICFAIL